MLEVKSERLRAKGYLNTVKEQSYPKKVESLEIQIRAVHFSEAVDFLPTQYPNLY